MRFTLQLSDVDIDKMALRSPHKGLYSKAHLFGSRKPCGMPGCTSTPTAWVLRKVSGTGVFQFFVCMHHLQAGDVPASPDTKPPGWR